MCPQLRVSQEDTVEDCLAAMASGAASGTQLRRRTSVSLLSNEQVRTSVVRELVQTERDFVKVLRDVAEGYIAECRRRTDMFSEEQIETIFINLEELLDFQSEFLKDLEASIDWNAPHKSCVGECFLNHVSNVDKTTRALILINNSRCILDFIQLNLKFPETENNSNVILIIK